MPTKRTAMVLTALSLALTPSVALSETGQSLFYNGAIWTANDAQKTAEAVLVDGNTITFVGSEAEARKMAGDDVTLVDLKGQMLLPAFHDTHIHTNAVGLALAKKCDVSGLGTPEEMIAKFETCEAKLPEGEWLVGMGWALGAFEKSAPSKELIDAHFPDRPFYALAEDGHSAWVNSRAFEIAGITKDTPDPLNGWILKTDDGELQGTLREYAKNLFDEYLPVYGDAEMADAYRAFMHKANEYGITSVVEAWGTPESLRQVRELADTGENTVRFNFTMYVDPSYEGDLSEYIAYYHPDDDWVKVSQIKWWLDGVMEAQTAAMTENYVGQDQNGQLFYDTDKLKKWAVVLEDAGYQLHMHAIGDRASKQGLEVLEYSRKERGAETNNSPYFAHSYSVDPADFPWIKAANATLNMTMLWRQNNDSMLYLVKPYVTPEVYKSLMPMAEAIDAGINVAGGSDAPVGQFNPLASIKVGVTGAVVPYFEGGYFDPDQEKWDGKMVSLEDMLKAYTINAANFEGNGAALGSIEQGKKADLIVLDKDLFAIDPMDIYDAKVTKTLVDGKVVFER